MDQNWSNLITIDFVDNLRPMPAGLFFGHCRSRLCFGMHWPRFFGRHRLRLFFDKRRLMIFFKRCWSISSKTFSVNVYQCYFLDDVSYDFFFVRLWLGLFFCLCCLEFLVDVDWWFFFPMQFFKWWWLSFLKLTLIGVIFWLMSSKFFLTNASDIFFYQHWLGFFQPTLTVTIFLADVGYFFGWCRLVFLPTLVDLLLLVDTIFWSTSTDDEFW